VKYHITILTEDTMLFYLLNEKTLKEYRIHVRESMIKPSDLTYVSFTHYVNENNRLGFDYIGTVAIEGGLTMSKIKKALPEFFL